MMTLSNNNTGHFLISEKTTNYGEIKKNSFSKFLKEKRKDVETGKIIISTKELAKRLGISYDVFRKIIDNNRPTKKRDCIIAICAALELDIDETNDALRLYNYMPCLDAFNPRDDLIIDILYEQSNIRFKPLSIPEINQRLVQEGFPKLDIIDHRSPSTPFSEKEDSPFKLYKKRLRVSIGDDYNSLSEQYHINRYHCIAEMWLEDINNNKGYRLISRTGEKYSLLDYGDSKPQHFTSLEEAGVFKDYFIELNTMIERKTKELNSTLNDTKNYHLRVSAGIRNDALHVYAETYNYAIPELREYYLLEYINGEYVMSVFYNSEFMRCYLQPKEYHSIYGNNPNQLIARYNSIDDIKNSSPNAIASEAIIKIRVKAFEKLKIEIEALISDIKNRKRFIQDLEYISDNNKTRVCIFYGVEEEFKCYSDDEFGDIMYADVDNAKFKLTEGEYITITLDDLCQAFELGLKNIDEICRVKKKLGSIKKITQIDRVGAN